LGAPPQGENFKKAPLLRGYKTPLGDPLNAVLTSGTPPSLKGELEKNREEFEKGGKKFMRVKSKLNKTSIEIKILREN